MPSVVDTVLVHRKVTGQCLNSRRISTLNGMRTKLEPIALRAVNHAIATL